MSLISFKKIMCKNQNFQQIINLKLHCRKFSLFKNEITFSFFPIFKDQTKEEQLRNNPLI